MAGEPEDSVHKNDLHEIKQAEIIRRSSVDQTGEAVLDLRGDLAQKVEEGGVRNADDLEALRETRRRLRREATCRTPSTPFRRQRKEPLTDAQHVRNAVARFDQVIGVSDADRALAFANIEEAAKYYNVDLSETSWHDLGVHPQHHRKEAAAKGVETKRRRGEL